MHARFSNQRRCATDAARQGEATCREDERTGKTGELLADAVLFDFVLQRPEADTKKFGRFLSVVGDFR